MKLVAGLGNPSPRYESTRHNAGFRVMDGISSASGIRLGRRRHGSLFGRGAYQGEDVILAKPQTYVNLSGKAVCSFLKYYPLSPEDLIIIHDDMDLPLGRIRIKRGGGSAGHRGVDSIISEIGTGDFPRLKVGISAGESGLRGRGFVLGNFSREEEKILSEVLSLCVSAVEEMIFRGLEAAMNRFN